MNKYISNWNNKEHITFLLDSNGDNLDGFQIAKRFIEEYIQPDLVRSENGWDFSKIIYTKDGFQFDLEFNGLIGITLRMNFNSSKEQENQLEIWANMIHYKIQALRHI